MAVDRISILPDDTLCHILSFLPIIEAVRTMILSKRWKQLFRLLSVLNFDGTDFSNYTSFRRFVDALIMSPLSATITLQSFTLYSRSQSRQQDNDLFNAWSESAIQRRVKEFHLTLRDNILNPNIFISQHLVVLKLESLSIANDTSCVHLPSLKTLFLDNVEFENRIDCINFFSACPNLEDLDADYFNYNLKKDGENNAQDEERFKSLTLSKLVRARICPMNFMFQFANNVEFLRLNVGTNEEVSFKAIPVFRNLIHIELDFLLWSSHCWDEVVELLRHCPKLQILFISKLMGDDSSKEWEWPISDLECVSSHLRSCTINFDGSANDLRFAKYILQNASLLQDIKISVLNAMSEVMPKGMFLEESQIVEQLSSCPKISPECKLSFQFKDNYYDSSDYEDI